MRNLIWVVSVVAVVSVCDAFGGTYSGGMGTADDPYRISSEDDLNELSNSEVDWNKHFLLTVDLDLESYTFDKSVISPDQDTERSYQGTPFTGVFNGGGHVISNLNFVGMRNSDYLGFFGFVEEDGIILNVTFKDVEVNGDGFIGGVMGVNHGTVKNCHVTGSVNGGFNNNVGGIAGANSSGIIIDCSMRGSVRGDTNVGGIAGGNSNGRITNCYADCTITGQRSVGVLAGDSFSGIIANCYSSGSAHGYRDIGGLVGQNRGTIRNSFASCSVSASGWGGGGLAGVNQGAIARCYSTGTVLGDSSIGGLVGGWSTGAVTHSYFLENSGPDNGFGTALSEEQMREQGSFSGFDFIGNPVDGIQEIWQMPQDGGYPVLSSFSGNMPVVLDGNGVKDDPYEISSLEELGALYHYGGDFCYELANDIDAEGVVWPDSVIPVLRGIFDGRGHRILNLSIDGPDWTGMFGTIAKQGSVKNLGLVDVIIKGNDETGGLCGVNYGSISDCYVTGSVSGNIEPVGGLAGQNHNIITDCITTVSVMGEDHVGGLLGENHGVMANCNANGSTAGRAGIGGLVGGNSDGVIMNCYSTGPASGEFLVGGAVGKNYSGIFVNCYAAGTVTVNSDSTDLGGFAGSSSAEGLIGCYFLSDCGPDNGFGIALSDDQMSEQGSFQDFDFVDNRQDGVQDIWQMPQSDGYPVLSSLNGYEPLVLSGSGTEDDPYLVSNSNELGAIYHYSWDACYDLANDIDVEGVHWSFAVIPAMLGVFDGNEHFIVNLSMTGKGHQSFFGIISDRGIVKNTGLREVNIEAGENGGGFCSRNYGQITNCYVTGSVSGHAFVGALVAENYGSIMNCYSNGVTIGDGVVGGLVGCNYNDVTRSFSIGSVIGNASVSTGCIGGLAGSNSGGTISDCYSNVSIGGTARTIAGLVGGSTGVVRRCYAIGEVGGTAKYHSGLVGGNAVGNIFDSFWDVETTGVLSSRGGGLGLVTSVMKDITLYGFSGWSGEVWVLEDGQNYPRFAWENSEGVEIIMPAIGMAGNGSEIDPYQIATVEDYSLITLGRIFWDKHLLLVNDLDLAGLEIQRIGYDEHHAFSGVFDGDRHVIRNLKIELPDSSQVGMFGVMSGLVRDLGIEGVIVKGDDYVGGLAGKVTGPIRRSYVSGAVDGDMQVGGLAGSIGSSIAKSFSRCAVNGNVNVGGLAGASSDDMTYCYSISQVSGREMVGGLVGQVSDFDEVVQCFAASSVFAEEEKVGGLAGLGGWGTNCFWDKDVAVGSESFNKWGLTTASMKQKGTYIFNFWDELVWTIDDGNDYPHLEWENAPGEALSFEVTMEGSGTEKDPYEIRTAEEFAVIGLGRYFCDKHFVLMSDLDLEGMDIYPIGGYSYEYSFKGSFDGGDHVIRNLRIDTAEQDHVGMFGNVDYGGSVRNLGLEGVFVRGKYDVGGLAGVSAGIIEDCYVTGEVEGYLQAGVLLGINNTGEIRRCYARGTVTGFTEVGGLIGINYSDHFDEERIGLVSECYASCEVNGIDDYPEPTGRDQYVGGLVGVSFGHLENCYSSSTVNIDSDGWYNIAGGLVGRKIGGAITNCYSSGSVSVDGVGGVAVGLVGDSDHEITGSYWDVEASGVDVSHGGFGLSTAEMQRQAIYKWAGWDLAGENDNGIFDIWRICDGTGYPRLWWEDITGDFVSPCGVGMEDFGIFASIWLSDCDGLELPCDPDDAGGDVVDLSDLVEFASNWHVYGCLRDNSDLVGYWTFDENEGREVHDSSMYEHDGVFSRDLMDYSWKEGYVNSCLRFPAFDHFVEMAGFNGIGGGDSRTVCAWFLTERKQGTIISWGTSEVTGGKWVFCTDEEGRIRVDIGDGFISGSTDVCDNQWHHVAAVLVSDGSSDISEVLLYVDGVLEPTGDCVEGAVDTVIDSEDSFNLRIGSGKDPSDVYLSFIDEVRVYNRGLSEEEILELVVGIEEEPIASWHFDGTSGSIALDSMGYGFDGTLLNMDDSDWVAGKAGNALSFDGVDDRVQIYGFRGIVGERSRSVCAWIKTFDTEGEIVSWGANAIPGGRWVFVTEGDGRLRLEVGGGAIVGSTFVCDGEWHYVCAVLDSDGTPNVNEVRLYVDGVLDVPSIVGDRAINTVLAPDVKIGLYGGGQRYFEGLIDEVRIYDRALGGEEIGELAK